MKNRRDKLLGGLSLSRLTGAEICPLHNPLVSKAEGHVIYVEHRDTESLRKAWSQDKAVDVSKIRVRHGLLDSACATFHHTAFNDFEFSVSVQVSVDTTHRVESWPQISAMASPHHGHSVLNQ